MCCKLICNSSLTPVLLLGFKSPLLIKDAYPTIGFCATAGTFGGEDLGMSTSRLRMLPASKSKMIRSVTSTRHLVGLLERVYNTDGVWGTVATVGGRDPVLRMSV